VSYLLQMRAREREALAFQAQAPFLDEGSHLPTVAEVIAEFDEWLVSEIEQDVSPQDAEKRQLDAAMLVRRRG
jgi:hypothetical protein